MSVPIKLTKAEGLALAAELVAVVGAPAVASALVSVIGNDRAQAILGAKEGRISKSETVALVKAIIPLIPGATLKAKIKVAIAALRRAIPDKARQDEILAYVVQRIKDYKNQPAVVPVVTDGFLRFYGRVNMWCAGGEDELRKDLMTCSQHGVGYQIEMAGWRSGETAYDGHLNLSRTLETYRLLHKWCKTAKVPLFVSIANWNVTQTKYGNKGRSFASVVPVAKQLAQCVKDCGGQDFVYVQPVAETDKNDSAAVGFEKWCGKLFAGWKLVYNGGSRPSKPAYGWPHFAYHPNTTADGGKRGGITISDTGTIIKQLAADGTLEGPGDPAKIAAWFAKCKAAGAIGAGYYAFKREKHDAEAIKACATASGNSTGAEVPASGATHLGDDVDLSNAEWVGKINGAKAIVTDDLAPFRHDSKTFFYKQTPGTKNWKPRFTDNGKDLNSAACLAVWRDGRWRVGRFDDCSETRNTREKKNIVNGYLKGIQPVVGEPFRFLLVNADGKYRTKAPGGIWTQ